LYSITSIFLDYYPCVYASVISDICMSMLIIYIFLKYVFKKCLNFIKGRCKLSVGSLEAFTSLMNSNIENLIVLSEGLCVRNYSHYHYLYGTGAWKPYSGYKLIFPF